MILIDLQVMLGWHGGAVADPLAYHMDGELLRQLRLSCAAEILKEPRPRGQPGAFDDSLQTHPQIDLCIGVPCDHELSAGLGPRPRRLPGRDATPGTTGSAANSSRRDVRSWGSSRGSSRFPNQRRPY